MPDSPPPEPPARIAGKTKHGELTIDEIAELQPGLGRLMPEISESYAFAYHAAKGGNWKLAGYYVKKTVSLFRLCAIARPKHKERLERYRAQILDPLQKHVEGRDLAAFQRIFDEGVTLANRDHVETGHPEIVWQLPSAPSHLKLTE